MKKLWYVDDDNEMIQAVKLMLQLLGYETTAFLDARKAAKQLLAGEQPDVLMLDINMPRVSGLDMLEFVRHGNRWKHLPVIMLSSEAADLQVDSAMELGADAYVFKPVTMDELEAAINMAAAKRKEKTQ